MLTAHRLHQGRLQSTPVISSPQSLRSERLATFDHVVRQSLAVPGLVSDACSSMLRLCEAKVDNLADLLKVPISVQHYTRLLRRPRWRRCSGRIGASLDVNDKLRLSLTDKQRVLSFLAHGHIPAGRPSPLLAEILRDVNSLMDHSLFLFQKADSLANAFMGRINIEQNQISKIFSLAAVVFLPPTLIASIYGMNFQHMPGLSWPWGYPLALGLMVISGMAPYWLFRRKGWL